MLQSVQVLQAQNREDLLESSSVEGSLSNTTSQE